TFYTCRSETSTFTEFYSTYISLIFLNEKHQFQSYFYHHSISLLIGCVQQSLSVIVWFYSYHLIWESFFKTKSERHSIFVENCCSGYGFWNVFNGILGNQP